MVDINREKEVVKTTETIDSTGITLTSSDGYSVGYRFNKDGDLVDEWESDDWEDTGWDQW